MSGHMNRVLIYIKKCTLHDQNGSRKILILIYTYELIELLIDKMCTFTLLSSCQSSKPVGFKPVFITMNIILIVELFIFVGPIGC